MLPFCFVVRKFQLVFGRFFVVGITCITSLVLLQVADRNEFTSRRDMIDFPRKTDLLGIEGIGLTELYSVEWLSSGTKRFPDLRRIR